jgi:hypothetical protein
VPSGQNGQGYLEANDWAFDVGLLASLTAPARQHEFERVEREQGFRAALRWLHARYD